MQKGNLERAKFSLSTKKTSSDSILEICREHGVCIIDSFLSDREVEAVRDETADIYSDIDGTRGVTEHTKAEFQHALMVQYEDLDTDSHPALADLVTRPEFEDSVRSYYDEKDVQYPSNLFIARSFGTETSPEGVISDDPPYALHYDKINKFKFFFYLTDVKLDHGPTHFAPGLHREVKEQRLRELDEGRDVSELSNTLKHVERDMIPVTAEAGTLLIFDTDVPHKAGGLSKGYEREVLRIDSLSPSHSGRETSITDRLKQHVTSLLG